MSITEDRMTRALRYLAETDEKVSRAKAYMLGIDKQEKTILAINFLKTEGTVAEREANSRVSPEYKTWKEEYENAVVDYEILKNKRSTEVLIIEVWRSLNSQRRRGNIV